jgi:hypothetical protein
MVGMIRMILNADAPPTTCVVGKALRKEWKMVLICVPYILSW